MNDSNTVIVKVNKRGKYNKVQTRDFRTQTVTIRKRSQLCKDSLQSDDSQCQDQYQHINQLLKEMYQGNCFFNLFNKKQNKDEPLFLDNQYEKQNSILYELRKDYVTHIQNKIDEEIPVTGQEIEELDDRFNNLYLKYNNNNLNV